MLPRKVVKKKYCQILRTQEQIVCQGKLARPYGVYPLATGLETCV